jgi:hypothetical protein
MSSEMQVEASMICHIAGGTRVLNIGAMIQVLAASKFSACHNHKPWAHRSVQSCRCEEQGQGSASEKMSEQGMPQNADTVLGCKVQLLLMAVHSMRFTPDSCHVVV